MSSAGAPCRYLPPIKSETDRCCAAPAPGSGSDAVAGGGGGEGVKCPLHCAADVCLVFSVLCLQPARHILSIQADFTFLADFRLDSGY